MHGDDERAKWIMIFSGHVRTTSPSFGTKVNFSISNHANLADQNDTWIYRIGVNWIFIIEDRTERLALNAEHKNKIENINIFIDFLFFWFLSASEYHLELILSTFMRLTQPQFALICPFPGIMKYAQQPQRVRADHSNDIQERKCLESSQQDA